MKNGFIIQSKILNKALESKLQDSKLKGFIESKTLESKTIESKTLESKTLDSKTIESKHIDSIKTRLFTHAKNAKDSILKGIYIYIYIYISIGTLALANPLDSNTTDSNTIDSSATQNIESTTTTTDTTDDKEAKKAKGYKLQAVTTTAKVTSATGYEQNLRDAPASISVITHEEIMSRPVRDIGDIVQDVPGVYTESTKVGGNEIRMRGLGTAYTLILIDGKRQNIARGFDANGWAGTFSGFMPPASMIERVEVIRGPASIIYGSDAMGGVINIITKKHTDKLTMGLQADTKLAENHNVFGNQYGINGYINVPIIKKMLSINLRGGYKYGEQNSFLKPLGLQACSWATTNGNRVCNIGPANYTNPYATWSSTGFTNWNAGARINYTPTSSDYIYLDSEVYFARTGSLNTSGN
ncbi:TonB-dependent receptor plug domain-containing protein [Helicobacter saguini]|nr:TonB-dependent receptor plug domain-containing protein [Helicobacter saguini]MWV69248.1 TonB-dependent receptor plug domain-containing protein [Helicobacter saguini]